MTKQHPLLVEIAKEKKERIAKDLKNKLEILQDQKASLTKAFSKTEEFEARMLKSFDENNFEELEKTIGEFGNNRSFRGE